MKRRERERPTDCPPSRTPEEKAEKMIRKLKRTGAWDGLVAARMLGLENAKK